MGLTRINCVRSHSILNAGAKSIEIYRDLFKTREHARAPGIVAIRYRQKQTVDPDDRTTGFRKPDQP